MLQEIGSLLWERKDFFAGLVLEHLQISLLAILIAIVIGGIFGLFISEFQKAAKPALGAVNFLYTIPSISMLGFLIPFSGVGNATAVIALTVYALLPMVRNTYTGMTNVDSAILEAAKGMGSTRLQILFKIRLPLAMPVIMSGIRSMVTMTIALAGIASTVSRLAFDACLFNSQNFGFIKLPDEYTTGSSIMPHKKNPDVFELTRAKCNRLQSLPYQITMILNNLPSGYFRDMQLIKEAFLPAFDELKSILSMVNAMLREIKVNENIVDDERYKFMFSVEEVNRLTREGMPFRDAYKKVGLDIEAGKFEPVKEVHHTHAGSIGNLCNDRIEELFRQTMDSFRFQDYHKAIDRLLTVQK